MVERNLLFVLNEMDLGSKGLKLTLDLFEKVIYLSLLSLMFLRQNNFSSVFRTYNSIPVA